MKRYTPLAGPNRRNTSKRDPDKVAEATLYLQIRDGVMNELAKFPLGLYDTRPTVDNSDGAKLEHEVGLFEGAERLVAVAKSMYNEACKAEASPAERAKQEEWLEWLAEGLKR